MLKAFSDADRRRHVGIVMVYGLYVDCLGHHLPGLDSRLLLVWYFDGADLDMFAFRLRLLVGGCADLDLGRDDASAQLFYRRGLRRLDRFLRIDCYVLSDTGKRARVGYSGWALSADA